MAQILKEEKLIYTTHEDAKILHSSPKYIYELISNGKIPIFVVCTVFYIQSVIKNVDFTVSCEYK